MIKVNLLRTFGKITIDDIQMSDEPVVSNIGFFKNIIVMFLGVIALFAHEQINIPELTTQLTALNAEIAEATRFNQKMDSLKREIEKYEKDLKRLNTQTGFLQKVQKERQLAVDLINKMKSFIPEKVWLSAVQVTQNSIEIKGDAESNADVNDFNSRLSAATFLKDVVIVSSTLKSLSRMSIQTFNIKANYVDGKQLIGSDDDISMETTPSEPQAQPPAPPAAKGEGP